MSKRSGKVWGGRLVRQEQAQGILLAALGMLVAHFGYGEARRASEGGRAGADNHGVRNQAVQSDAHPFADEEGRGGTVLVASGDRDAFQLASDKTTILQPVRAGEIARIGPAEVLERYGVEPAQMPDFIALRGDPSDKLPGARGVGPKGAAKLLRQHGTLEGALEAGRLAAQADDLRLYRRIATMDRAAPLPPLPDQTPTWATAAELARAWELNRLAERLAALAQSAQ